MLLDVEEDEFDVENRQHQMHRQGLIVSGHRFSDAPIRHY
jgi:hypothetical protein